MRHRGKVFLAILTALVLYTSVQVSRLAPRLSGGQLGAATGALFGLMIGSPFAYRSRPGLVEKAWFRALCWTGAAVSGAWATFTLLSIPFDLGAWALPLGEPGTRACVLASVAGVLAGLGLKGALEGPVVVKVDVPVPGLHPDLDGLTVAQVSDLHVGPTIRAERLARVVMTVASLQPDLIAVTGDSVDGTVETLGDELAPLVGLKAPLGAYYVTGNHEYYWGAEQWLDKARELGLTTLVNESRLVARGAATVRVGGVPDSQAGYFIPSHEPDAAAAAAGHADLKVLLAHRPDEADAAERAGFHLQLSGHTHGGQFFPFSVLVRLVHRYARGLHRHGRLALYVNPGTGFWGPPHRFAVPSEISLLTLRRTAS